MGQVEIRRFDSLPWSDDVVEGDDGERMRRAAAQGYRRKPLLQGEQDVHLTHIQMGPGMEVEPHSHSAAEVIHVLAGSLTPHGADAALTAGDSLVVPAGADYGFRVGADGVKFLIFRPSAAAIAYRD
jgi:quercetin dioxygenase-like cupin family protein